MIWRKPFIRSVMQRHTHIQQLIIWKFLIYFHTVVTLYQILMSGRWRKFVFLVWLLQKKKKFSAFYFTKMQFTPRLFFLFAKIAIKKKVSHSQPIHTQDQIIATSTMLFTPQCDTKENAFILMCVILMRED